MLLTRPGLQSWRALHAFEIRNCETHQAYLQIKSENSAACYVVCIQFYRTVQYYYFK